MDLARSDAPEKRNTTLLGCLLLLAFLAYANTLVNGFVYDDHSQIEQNPYVHSFGNIGRLFGTSLTVGNYYRPLMNLDFLLCFKLFGSSPYGFHLINVLLHCVVVCLVYAVGAALTSDETFGLIAGACFALHPIHTESVDWIAGVADIEMAIFYLLAFWLFLRLDRAQIRTAWMQTGMLGSFLLATLSKEPAMTLPALATLYEHFYRADRRSTAWKKKLSRYGGFWAIGLIYFGARARALGGFAPARFHADIGWPQAGLIGFSWIGQYAVKLLWPVPLTVFYSLQKTVSSLGFWVLLGAAVLISAGALVAYEWKRARVYTFALLWIFLTLAPVLNVRWIPMDVFAERYLYLPSVGFCWLASGTILWCWRKSEDSRVGKRWALGVAAGLLGLLATGEIVARNRDWRDDRSLALRTLQTNPDDSNMRSDVGMMEWHAGHHAEAMRQWHLALAYEADSSKALSDLGFALVEEKKYTEAMPYLQKAIELSPHFAIPHVHLAHAYAALGKNAEAEGQFRRAVEIGPLDPFVRNALGRFYLALGRAHDAETEFRASVTMVTNYDGWSGLAEAYALENIPDKAEEAWRQVLAFEPYDSQAHLGLGRIYLAKGLSREAAREFDQCLFMDPNNAEARAALRHLSSQGSSR